MSAPTFVSSTRVLHANVPPDEREWDRRRYQEMIRWELRRAGVTGPITWKVYRPFEGTNPLVALRGTGWIAPEACSRCEEVPADGELDAEGWCRECQESVHRGCLGYACPACSSDEAFEEARR